MIEKHIMIGSKRPSRDGESSFSSETILQQPSTSTGPPPLKLRIKHQSVVQKLTVDIYEAGNVREKLCSLLHFSHQLRLIHVRGEECEQLLRLLKDIVKKESDHLLRSKAIELMGDVCCIPGANKIQCIEEILDSLHKESKNQVFLWLCVARNLIMPQLKIIYNGPTKFSKNGP